MVSRTLPARVAAPLLALAVSAAAGFVGSLVTRPATAADRVVSTSTSAPSALVPPPANAPVSGWLELHTGSRTFTVRTVQGAELTVLLTPQTRYYVEPSPVAASADVLKQGAFVVVDGHVEWLWYTVVAVNVTVIPNFRGARPGFEGHRDAVIVNS